VQTELLLDGGGSHIAVVGAFVAPLAPGDHVVKLHGVLTGAAYIAGNGMASNAEITYAVHVVAAQ